MLNSTVPTPANAAGRATGGLAVASIANTSLSGKRNSTSSSQRRPMLSSQCSCPSAGSMRWRTIRPFGGAALPSALVNGGGSPPWPLTSRSLITVVRLPDSNAAAYTVAPSGATASARGVSANSAITVSGVPPSDAPSRAASNTQTSARPTPGVVSCGSRPVFWPRCAVVMNARRPPGPAKAMSRGSSPTSRVRTTWARCGTLTSTMLTLSDR
jgi:hypothetical protein